MSGRFGLFHVPDSLAGALPGVQELLQPRWNLAPRQQVVLVRHTAGGREAAQALWGFTPRWSNDMSHVATHARCETVLEQDFFATAIRQQRGVLPANGFYEWRGRPGTQKQPYWLTRPGELLYMAAVWEPYPVAGHEYLSVALLTRQAAYLRRPLLLRSEDLTAWLDPATPEEQLHALLTADNLSLQERRVSTLVNDPAQDGPECIRAL